MGESEVTARALGVGDPTPIVIAGKECFVRPLGLNDLLEVHRDCLKRYKREYLETFSENADLLEGVDKKQLVEDRMVEAAKWDVDDLPTKRAHDPTKIKVTTGLRTKLGKMFSLPDSASEVKCRMMTAVLLDQGMLSGKEYKTITGEDAPYVDVPYVNWWITGCYDGMISFIWICFRRYGVTRTEVIDAIGNDLSMLMEISRSIERHSVPQAGNG